MPIGKHYHVTLTMLPFRVIYHPLASTALINLNLIPDEKLPTIVHSKKYRILNSLVVYHSFG